MMRRSAPRRSAPPITSLWLTPSKPTIFNPAPSVRNRSAIPDANTASVSGSSTENFRDELPQLMTRIGKRASTRAEWRNGHGIVNPRERRNVSACRRPRTSPHLSATPVSYRRSPTRRSSSAQLATLRSKAGRFVSMGCATLQATTPQLSFADPPIRRPADTFLLPSGVLRARSGHFGTLMRSGLQPTLSSVFIL